MKQTMSGAEATALAAAERAKRAAKSKGAEPQAPQLSAEELDAFRAWQKAQQEEQARKAIGVQAFTVEKGETEGTLDFGIAGTMPGRPNDKGAFLNDNSKVIISGKAYTLLVSLFPYNGKQSPERLRAMGDVVGSF